MNRHCVYCARLSMKRSSTSFAEFILSESQVSELEAYLKTNNRIEKGEQITEVCKAGEGNMNCVLKVTTNAQTFVLKQSRPWVEKYPEVPAPIERLESEGWFYNLLKCKPAVAKFTPEVFWHDSSNHLEAMEFLSGGSDFSNLYRKGVELNKSEMAAIATFVSELHFQFDKNAVDDLRTNREMRELNHQHIFELPLQENNGFDLDQVMDGLQKATVKFRKCDELKSVAKSLGELYLNEEGRKLLHGDYYPGSWLRTDNGLKVIDPEFCFFGPPEFELAVAVAHLKMAQQPDSLIKDIFVYYHFDEHFDGSLFTKFAGMEVIRRIIGLAQLPLELNLKERLSLLDEAYEWVVSG